MKRYLRGTLSDFIESLDEETSSDRLPAKRLRPSAHPIFISLPVHPDELRASASHGVKSPDKLLHRLVSAPDKRGEMAETDDVEV